jgi:hypothetical protein
LNRVVNFVVVSWVDVRNSFTDGGIEMSLLGVVWASLMPRHYKLSRIGPVWVGDWWWAVTVWTSGPTLLYLILS